MAEQEQWSVKHRPRKLEDFVGSPDTVKLVQRFMEQRNGHALLLSGQSGCGKTTLANIIARHYAGGIASNIKETNAASDSGIDEVRAMIESSRYYPTVKDSCRVFILEEAHGLTKKAASALLRPIEEPPHNQLIWIFVSDRPWVLDAAILNRMRKFPVDVPDEREVALYLRRIAKREKAFTKLSEDEFKKASILIARAAGNVPREAVQIMQNAHDIGLKDYSALKKYAIVSASTGDTQMDKIASNILVAILGKDKADEAVSKVVTEYAKVDAMGLLSRCVFQLHSLLLFALADKRSAYYAIKHLVDGLKGQRPPVENMVLLLRVLGKTRNELKEVVLDPSTVILPTMLDCVFKLRGE